MFLKKGTTGQNGVTFAEHITKSELNNYLIADLASPRSEILNPSVWNFLISTSEITCLIKPPALP